MGYSSNVKSPVDEPLAGGVHPAQMVSQDSCFGDATWNLSSLIYRKNITAYHKRLVFNFPLPNGSRFNDPPNAVLYTSTKEFLYWRLQGDQSNRAAKADTLIGQFAKLRVFILWMIANQHYWYSQLCPHHVELQFLSFLRGNSGESQGDHRARTDGQIVQFLYGVQRLWEYRRKMSDSLTFSPFGGRLPTKVLGVSTSRIIENKTPRIPDEIMTPLGNHALNYVYAYSDDIIKARARLEALREELNATSICKYARGARGQIIFGVYGTNSRAKAVLREIDIAAAPDTGMPWREPFSTESDLYREEAYLFTACYIVIAWLTGMRYSEMTSLCENCLRRERSDDGLVELIKVKGTLFKGVRDPRGREETWVTIEPVAKAIEVLTRITQRLRDHVQGEVTELFLKGDRTLNVVTLKGGYVCALLQQFADHIRLPRVDGKVWRLSTRQFRRTLAWWIARRPFGELAGMLQFKHLELTTFEGYVGRDDEFRKDLAEEHLLANIDLLEDLKQDALAGNVAGPKAPELIEAFRGIAGDRRSNDEAYMLKHLAKTLHVGPFNLCFYDPSHAMCQQHLLVEERKSPITSHCQPDRCANSCITKQHLRVYQIQLNESKQLLKTPKLPIPQRMALEQESARIERLVSPLLDSSES